MIQLAVWQLVLGSEPSPGPPSAEEHSKQSEMEMKIKYGAIHGTQPQHFEVI